MRFLNKLLEKIAIKLFHAGDYHKLYSSNNYRDLHSQITYQDAHFYPDTIVVNPENDNSKIVVGDKSHVRGTLLVFPYGGKITIGTNCYIGDGCRIWSSESISIGDDVLVSHNVNIIDTNSHEIDYKERAINGRKILQEGLPKVKGNILSAPITIHDNVWISFNAIILKGVTIGRGAIVAAGAVVTKDVPEFTMVAGNPATVIKKIQ